jgi:hypothetical protein
VVEAEGADDVHGRVVIETPHALVHRPRIQLIIAVET